MNPTHCPATATTGDTRPVIETHSIGYIPRNERFGRPLNQFTLWFGSNLNITGMVTGAAAVVLTGTIVWTLVGLVVGQILGGVIMALHSAQGPKLGLPQMISSRAQFGVYGAMLPLVLAVLMYIGWAATSGVLAGQAIASLIGSTHAVGVIVFGAMTTVITIIGYRLIHMMGRISTVVGAVAFTYLCSRLLLDNDIAALLGPADFSLSKFLLAVSLSASFQITYGPYVADYSRYLPANTPTWKTFLTTLTGTVLGAQFAMTFGALAAAVAGPSFSDNEVGHVVSVGGAGVIAAALYTWIAFGKLTVNVLNVYGGFMSLVTTVTGFIGQREISRTTRVITVTAITTLSTIIAVFATQDFLSLFSTLLLILLTFFTPWSAINLVDFYCLSKERYDVPALSDANGRYGRWNKIAIITYFIGLLVQVPFLYTGLYDGPAAKLLGGTDISWIIGLIVPGAIYYVWSKAKPSIHPDRMILPDDPAVNGYDVGALAEDALKRIDTLANTTA